MEAELFAHINLDTEISGSKLEGSNITISAKFLLRMAEQFNQEFAFQLPPKVLDTLKHLSADNWQTDNTVRLLSWDTAPYNGIYEKLGTVFSSLIRYCHTRICKINFRAFFYRKGERDVF